MVVVIAGGKVHCLNCQGLKGLGCHDNRHVVENTVQGGRLYLSVEDTNLFGINVVYLANMHKKNIIHRKMAVFSCKSATSNPIQVYFW